MVPSFLRPFLRCYMRSTNQISELIVEGYKTRHEEKTKLLQFFHDFKVENRNSKDKGFRQMTVKIGRYFGPILTVLRNLLAFQVLVWHNY